MPGCAAINCTNSAKKGFTMKHFPSDPDIRKEWVVRIKRDKWTPTKYSCICEEHFEPQMWEKPRVDGKRKLKVDAVPTLFSLTKSKPKRKPGRSRTAVTVDEVAILSTARQSPILVEVSDESRNTTGHHEGFDLIEMEEKFKNYEAFRKVKKTYKKSLRNKKLELKRAEQVENFMQRHLM